VISSIKSRTISRPSKRLSSGKFGLLVVMPSLLVLILILVIPGILTINQSFRKVPTSGLNPGPFIGLENYILITTSPIFWDSVRITLLFAGFFVFFSTLIGLMMAILLDQKFFGAWFLKGLLIIPWAAPWLIIGIIWKWFVDGSIGLLNGTLFRLGLISEYQDFLTNPSLVLYVTALAATWRQSCLVAILFLAALSTLPRELIDASRVDGAGVFRRFWNIKLPWLRPALAIVTVLNIIYGLMQFDVIFAMTQGGPGSLTTILSFLIYRQMFVFTNYGVGSAIAVFLAILALVAGLIAVKTIYKRVEI
jgi:multiple sugar transport system permease protein